MGNRKEHFYKIFKDKNTSLKEMADLLNIKKDSLYRKIVGTNAFMETDMHVMAKHLNMSICEIFICKEVA